MEGSLLDELDIFRVTKEAAFGELWNVYTWQSLSERLSERFKLRKLALDLKITLLIESFNCVEDLSIAFYWIADFNLREALFVRAQHCFVENNAVVVSNFTIFCAILQVVDKFFMLGCGRWLAVHILT